MQRYFLTFFFSLFCLLSLSAQDDLVITEIMYNPPESGTDSLEYIEIYNNSPAAIDLEGYSLVGATFTFSAVSIEPGEYLVTAVKSASLQEVLGVTSFEWESGGLSNGGETIQLLDPNGAVIDEVTYDDGGAWPTSPDGDGPSLVLCDVNSDNNDGANWTAATTATGAIINGAEIFANPGAESGCPDGAVINFETASATVSEDAGQQTVEVIITFQGDIETNVEVGVLGTSSAVGGGVDYSFDGTTLTFPGGAATDTVSFTIDITDDMDSEGAETVVLGLSGPTNGAILGAVNTYVLTIEDNDTVIDYTEYTIGEVTQTDENGVGTFVDSLVQIQGVVYGVNMRPAGLQFTIIDENNDGIGLFFNEGDLGYAVNEGDEVIIQGQIGQFNGLLQINPEQITLVDMDNALFDPTVVTALGEDTESQLVRVENVSLVDANDWTGAGSGFNVEVSDGTNTYTVRIDADVDLYSMPAPTGTFNVTGLGGQFDNSSPFDGGYQLLPRYVADIDPYNEEEPMEPTYPEYDIVDVTGIDENGVADSLNTTCTLVGVVQSQDFRGGAGVQFFLHDGTDGIGVFDLDLDYYEVSQGDEVRIEGTIGQFNGLTQVNPDTLILVSEGNDLQNIQNLFPTEETESEYLRLDVFSWVDESQWTPGGAGFNIDIDVDGTIVNVRIDNDSDLHELTEIPPDGSFGFVSILGFGSQFDTSAPFDEGYQFLATDILIADNVNDLSLAENITISPNPAQEELFITVNDVSLEKITLTDLVGRTLIEEDGAQTRLDIKNLPKGFYTLTFYTKDRFYSEMVVKQ